MGCLGAISGVADLVNARDGRGHLVEGNDNLEESDEKTEVRENGCTMGVLRDVIVRYASDFDGSITGVPLP